MATGRRRRFNRKQSERAYRKLFLIATEGSVTEPAYFNMFQSREATVRIRVLESRHKSSPEQVFARAKKYIAGQSLREGDSVWLVLDRDSWQERVLNAVHQWCKTSGFQLAVSNPCFELWLLFHFENGSGVTSVRACRERLVRQLPHYKKGHVETDKLRQRLPEAIRHAEQKDVPPCEDWPRVAGSTVYRLVRELKGS